MSLVKTKLGFDDNAAWHWLYEGYGKNAQCPTPYYETENHYAGGVNMLFEKFSGQHWSLKKLHAWLAKARQELGFDEIGNRVAGEGERHGQKRGRTRGAGSYAPEDNVLVEDMRAMIVDRRAKSAWDAAGMLVERIPGGGTDDSKRKRIVRRYKARYPE